MMTKKICGGIENPDGLVPAVIVGSKMKSGYAACNVGKPQNSLKATIDFESRSAVSIKKVGTFRYSIDPSTEILCLAYRLPYWPEGKTALWYPSFPHLEIDALQDCPLDPLWELIEWIETGELVEAHNAFFERCMWQNILVPQHGFPPIAPSQWRCSAAKAAAHALPRGLDDATQALNLPMSKDMEGHKLMMKLSKPRKSRKKEREAWDNAGITHPKILWHESREWFERLWAYCRQDVLTETCLSDALPDLNEHETEVYVMDQTINERGFQLDRDAVTTALKLIMKETNRLNKKLADITSGCVRKATQRIQLLQWLEYEGASLPDTTKATVSEWLDSQERLTTPARKALEILRTLGKSSTAKYQKMKAHMGPDARVRGGLLYHGATTGRWSGSGVQPHNFVRSAL